MVIFFVSVTFRAKGSMWYNVSDRMIIKIKLTMNTKELEKILKVLASKRRLDIIKLLKQKRKIPLTEIAKEIKLSKKSTSKHLRILYSTGFLEREFIGLEVSYSLAIANEKITRFIINEIK